MKRRDLIVAGLAVVAAFVASGLRDTFGTGRASPELKRRVVEADGYEYGLSFGREERGRNFPRRSVGQLEMIFLNYHQTRGAQAEMWKVGFRRGYEDGFANPSAPRKEVP